MQTMENTEKASKKECFDLQVSAALRFREVRRNGLSGGEPRQFQTKGFDGIHHELVEGTA